MRQSMRSLLAALRVSAALAAFAAAPAFAQTQQNPNDLVSDRPSTLGAAWEMAKSSLGWASSAAGSVVSVVLPPSPTNLAASSKHDDGSELFRLLGLAGYKLKEIDNDVGIIPGVAFKFAIVRELSEADLDYLDEQLEVFRLHDTSLVADLQRAIIRTVVAINMAGGMQVSDLKLQVLPLPKASFSVTPSATVLGEEASTLMRAIQRIDRRMRSLATAEIVRPAAAAGSPTPPTR